MHARASFLRCSGCHAQRSTARLANIPLGRTQTCVATLACCCAVVRSAYGCTSTSCGQGGVHLGRMFRSCRLTCASMHRATQRMVYGRTTYKYGKGRTGSWPCFEAVAACVVHHHASSACADLGAEVRRRSANGFRLSEQLRQTRVPDWLPRALGLKHILRLRMHRAFLSVGSNLAGEHNRHAMCVELQPMSNWRI
jgi:hypothetical protein